MTSALGGRGGNSKEDNIDTLHECDSDTRGTKKFSALACTYTSISGGGMDFEGGGGGRSTEREQKWN